MRSMWARCFSRPNTCPNRIRAASSSGVGVWPERLGLACAMCMTPPPGFGEAPKIIRVTSYENTGKACNGVFKFYFCHGLFGYIFFRGPHRALLAWGERRHKSPVCLAEWYKPLRFVAEREDQYKQPNDLLQTFAKKKAEKIHFLPIF